ncbi:MAG: ATP-binding protein [Terracidiphilus sp.]|jgi:two-component system sensor histidine kinase FlrB
MLPSSHFAPINVPLLKDRSDGQVHAQADDLRIDGCVSGENESRDESATQSRSAALLAGEFSEFILAASRLENAYRALQEEVSELGLELSERNAALNASLAKNEGMRRALQQIVDSMPCGVLVLDRDGKLSTINPESKRLLRLDGPDFSDGSQMTLQRISAFSGINLESCCQNAPVTDTEQEFCVRDSSGTRWLEVRDRRLFHQAGGTSVLDQTILILRDITAQKRSEQEREAGRKAMALAEITTVLAHEIRNPLASLELFAELIDKDGDRRGEWISNLRAGIRSLSGTVNNVLSFHGSGAIKLAPLSLHSLIGNAIQFVQPLADQAAVSLDWIADENQTKVMGNESALQQVVLNLVSNAIRHTPAGGSVTVSLRPERIDATGENREEPIENVVVEFSDTGCGIRPDQIDRVFEPGFSGSGDTTGLGLAVCDRIMKQHGGRISVSNSVNSGALFTLSFPVLQMELATA